MVSERNGVDSTEVPTEPMCAGPPVNSLMGVIYKGSWRCFFQLPPGLVWVEVGGVVCYCEDLPHFTQKLQVWGPQLDPGPAGCPSGGFSQFPSGLTILQNNSQSSGKSWHIITVPLKQKEASLDWPKGESHRAESGKVPDEKVLSPSGSRYPPGTTCGFMLSVCVPGRLCPEVLLVFCYVAVVDRIIGHLFGLRLQPQPISRVH